MSSKTPRADDMMQIANEIDGYVTATYGFEAPTAMACLVIGVVRHKDAKLSKEEVLKMVDTIYEQGSSRLELVEVVE